ncbi:hypothetical protein [Cohnella sp. GCM10027633]|uniref:hypothetical protein n=1 Tax=unclassified Cohnella TaxID=2636738 RepID=UPI0036347D22
MRGTRGLAVGTALALSIALLAGCGSKDADNATGAEANAGVAQQQEQLGNGAAQGGEQGMMNRMVADLIGKVKSLDGNTLTVYKSSFQPGAMGGRGQGGQGGGGGMRGDRPSGDGQQQDGGQAPQDGQPGGGRGMSFENMFTDETVDITLTDATKIVKREFVDNEMKETELTIADLKADDIVNIALTDGTQEAATITIGMGGFGGGAGFGGGGGRGMDGNPPARDQGQAQ